MSEKQFKIGIIGAGVIADFHAPGYSGNEWSGISSSLRKKRK